MSGPFTPEKKTQIVLVGLRSPDKIMEVCREYGVHPVTYSHWKRAVLEVGAEAFRRGGKTYPDGLSRVNRRLEVEDGQVGLHRQYDGQETGERGDHADQPGK